ncbi:MAG: hypothetical protein GY804_11655 [Alphaproteobacteria bacterium]|nr:hypothetical protein [Alphaproteobacteria bacterium]
MKTYRYAVSVYAKRRTYEKIEYFHIAVLVNDALSKYDAEGVTIERVKEANNPLDGWGEFSASSILIDPE